MEPEVKVTRIRNRWHARLTYNGKVFDEMACSDRRDIGWICREVLRWFVKIGGSSEFASAARERQGTKPVGRVWWRRHLDDERDANASLTGGRAFSPVPVEAQVSDDNEEMRNG